ALTDSYIEVKAGADEDAETVGRLYDYSLVYVDETGTEWTKITSGNVTGYVKNAQLCFGQEAQAVMQESEEQDKELVAGYTLEEAEEKEAREEAERIAAEEAARKAEEEAAKKKQALSSVGTTYGSSVDASDEEVWLLACIIDWEAGSESYEGKLAVANVVLNRVKSGKWGSSITSVIYAPKQFSGVSDGNGNPSAKFAARLSSGPNQACIQAAKEALSGVNNVGNYTFFRSLSIANYSSYDSYMIIGSHCFY
ncbi:MAG: cell wall hydrolase, partial [Lachnospira sp.]|nr:cell wall hydrolase [Lachnospira sp.]